MQILIPQMWGEARVSAFLTSFHLMMMQVSRYSLSCKKPKNPKKMDSYNAHGLAHNTPRGEALIFLTQSHFCSCPQNPSSTSRLQKHYEQEVEII